MVSRHEIEGQAAIRHKTLCYRTMLVAAVNQEKALVGAFSVITNLRMDLFEALMVRQEDG